MGSDRKSKRTTYSSPSESEGEKKSKRQRTTVEDEEKKKRKREKKEKRKDKKSHKHSKDKSDKGKKSKDEHKRKHSKGEGRKNLAEIQELSNDDYFAKNNEFATWLKEEKNMFFSDLSSESTHELFSDFVKAWNRGKLEPHYYEGIASGPRTSHNWKIK